MLRNRISNLSSSFVWLGVRVWAFPNTLLGLIVGYLGVLLGGRLQRVNGCIEFHGKIVSWLLTRMLPGCGAAAMTLGHTILGQSPEALEITREHEHIHVRQYERWGPFFIPAYFLASLIAWIKGGDPYRDNVFEVEAYRDAPLNPDERC
jgi:hypothetical protein